MLAKSLNIEIIKFFLFLCTGLFIIYGKTIFCSYYSYFADDQYGHIHEDKNNTNFLSKSNQNDMEGNYFQLLKKF